MAKVIENFVPVKGYDGIYEVSNLGRIKSLERVDCKGQHRKSLFKSPSFDQNYYLITSLSQDRVNKMVKFHRVVADAFIPNPENKSEINHINGIKWDNRVENLEWVTPRENKIHAEEIGLRKTKGEANASSKLTNEIVLEIFNSNKSNKELAIQYQIGVLQISRIKMGYNWSHITGKSYKHKKSTLLDSRTVLAIFNDNLPVIELSSKYRIPSYVIKNLKRGFTYSKITGKTCKIIQKKK